LLGKSCLGLLDFGVDELVLSSMELTGERSAELVTDEGNVWEKNGDNELVRNGFIVAKRGK